MTSYEEIQFKKRAAVTQMSETISLIQKLDSRTFFQRPAWGDLNFADCIDIVDFELKPLLSLIQRCAEQCFDPNEMQSLTNKLQEVYGAINKISDFRVDHPDSIRQRNDLHSALTNSVRSLQAQIQPKTASLLLSELTSNSRTEDQIKFRREAASLIEKINDTYTDALARKSEMQSVLDSARQAVGKLGVGENAKIFSDQSNRLFWASIAWLVSTFTITLTSLYVAYQFYLHPLWTGNDMTFAIQIVVAKIIIVSMLISATVWCGKNYRAVAHEAAVNKHRANALSTFRTFVEATDEPDVRNAVLLEATRSIFSQAPSGYLDKSDTSGSDTRILEVVRSLSSIGKPLH